MIATIVGLVISHLYSDFLCMYIWCKILGKKYSKKATILVTFLCSSSRCLLKIYLFVIKGLEIVSLTSLITFSSFIIYIIVMFQSSIAKRLMTMTVTSILMMFMDFFATSFMIKVTGTFQFMQADGEWYTIVFAIVGQIFITVGLLALYAGMMWLERIKWESKLYQWMILFLPVSQWILGIYMSAKYFAHGESIPAMNMIGVCIGLAANIYMIVIFMRSNSRRRAEKALEQINQKYELEQMRYEQLKENQEEISKIRHDFQNYILTIKNMQ